jgi:hypothetical protein
MIVRTRNTTTSGSGTYNDAERIGNEAGQVRRSTTTTREPTILTVSNR